MLGRRRVAARLVGRRGDRARVWPSRMHGAELRRHRRRLRRRRDVGERLHRRGARVDGGHEGRLLRAVLRDGLWDLPPLRLRQRAGDVLCPRLLQLGRLRPGEEQGQQGRRDGRPHHHPRLGQLLLPRFHRLWHRRLLPRHGRHRPLLPGRLLPEEEEAATDGHPDGHQRQRPCAHARDAAAAASVRAAAAVRPDQLHNAAATRAVRAVAAAGRAATAVRAAAAPGPGPPGPCPPRPGHPRPGHARKVDAPRKPPTRPRNSQVCLPIVNAPARLQEDSRCSGG
mmetsp:Transcript_89/g.325  ORF Transcript_89/g.325 Transcript_89/m.325 type:complete len:283 (-) Transcript_89:47-895(-)